MIHRSGIPGAGNCGSLPKDALPPAVNFELQGQLHGHAEALPPAADGGQSPKDVEASAGEQRVDGSSSSGMPACVAYLLFDLI
jgi:hypothetical protein